MYFLPWDQNGFPEKFYGGTCLNRVGGDGSSFMESPRGYVSLIGHTRPGSDVKSGGEGSGVRGEGETREVGET